MIISGKNVQSIADELIYPYLNRLILSQDEIEVRETLEFIKILSDIGLERKKFLGIQKIIYHKNNKIAHDSLDLLRSMTSSKTDKIKPDVWRNAYPFFCARALSDPDHAIESLKILDALVDLDIIGDYQELQKCLWHESDNVAHLCLDLIRKIQRISRETKIEQVLPITMEPKKMVIPEKPKEEIAENAQDDEIKSKIINVLKKNPKYIDGLKEIRSKYIE